MMKRSVCADTIVHVERLGSRGFHDSFNHYVDFVSKHYEYCKTEA